MQQPELLQDRSSVLWIFSALNNYLHISWHYLYLKTFVVILDHLHEQIFYVSGLSMQQIDCNSPVYFDLEMSLKV